MADFHVDDPDLSHIHSSMYEHVYEPAEDSFLLMDALKIDVEHMKQCFWNENSNTCNDLTPYCVEIGCGSGIVISYLSLIFKAIGVPAVCWATDINPRAAAVARETMQRNGVVGDVVVTNFVDAFRTKCQRFDVIIFNPPYVPTPPEEMLGNGISVSWAGGERGREVLDKLLPQIPSLLSPKGTFYLVTIEENDVDEIVEILARSGLVHHIVNYRKAGSERLRIVRFTFANA